MSDQPAPAASDSRLIRLRYNAQLLHTDEIAGLEALLDAQPYTLLRHEIGPQAYNVGGDFFSQVVLFLDQKMVQDLLNGVAGGAAWDAIKFTVATIYRLIQHRTIKTMSSRAVTERSSSLCVEMQVQDVYSFQFKLDNVTPELAQESLDKLLVFLAEQRPVVPTADESSRLRSSTSVQYDAQANRWVVDSTMPPRPSSHVIRTIPIDDYLNSLETEG